MSQSLAIENGDLAIGNGRNFTTVSGRAKLQQDLALWLLERIGIDPATPQYGSRLDGGTIDGMAVEGFIGRFPSPAVLDEIRGEVITLVRRYQQLQYNKIQSEVFRLGQTTIDSSEAIDSIESVVVRAVGTTVLVQVALRAVNGAVTKLTLPVG